MSKRLRNVVTSFITKEGEPGWAKLSLATGKDKQTLKRWQKKGVPRSHDAYQVAVACGCGEAEALRLAKEECPDEARETA